MKFVDMTERLRRLPDKRAFCREHGLPERTLWRLLTASANPKRSTVDAFKNALAKQRRKRMAPMAPER